MPAIESEIFIQFPDEAKRRVLHPGRVISVTQSVYTADFEEANLEFSPGQDVLIYFEQDRRFMQQAARIAALIESDENEEADDASSTSGSIIGFETIGDPASAESRECFRVSTLMAQLLADVDGDTDCPLVDVSSTGFAVITNQHLKVGQVIRVSPKFEGKKFDGEACVQSVRELPGGRFRYGMHCVNKRDAGMLMRGLQQISMAIQRQQLKRMSRA